MVLVAGGGRQVVVAPTDGTVKPTRHQWGEGDTCQTQSGCCPPTQPAGHGENPPRQREPNQADMHMREKGDMRTAHQSRVMKLPRQNHHRPGTLQLTLNLPPGRQVGRWFPQGTPAAGSSLGPECEGRRSILRLQQLPASKPHHRAGPAEPVPGATSSQPAMDTHSQLRAPGT